MVLNSTLACCSSNTGTPGLRLASMLVGLLGPAACSIVGKAYLKWQSTRWVAAAETPIGFLRHRAQNALVVAFD